jgi:hypothetical protein
MPYSSPRLGVFAGLSLLLGLLFAYGLDDLGVGYPALNSSFAGISLFLSCALTSWILYKNYSHLPITYWGAGLALLLSILPLYFALKSGDFVCHITTAKLVTLSLAFVGACLALYGFVRSAETRQPVSNIASLDSATDWTPTEIKNLCLLTMLLLALAVLWRKFLVGCWW